jgi:hypothetical protein
VSQQRLTLGSAELGAEIVVVAYATTANTPVTGAQTPATTFLGE